jgi:HSP20 family protein
MAMVRWTPFGTSDLFDTFFGRAMNTAPMTRAWLPAVDMHETKDDLVLTVEVPGVSEKDVKVTINGDLLSIRGERRGDDEAKERQYMHVERVYGQFERLIQLPIGVQADKVRATYRDGLLQVTLPKAEELKPREVKIDIL